MQIDGLSGNFDVRYPFVRRWFSATKISDLTTVCRKSIKNRFKNSDLHMYIFQGYLGFDSRLKIIPKKLCGSEASSLRYPDNF